MTTWCAPVLSARRPGRLVVGLVAPLLLAALVVVPGARPATTGAGAPTLVVRSTSVAGGGGATLTLALRHPGPVAGFQLDVDRPDGTAALAGFAAAATRLPGGAGPLVGLAAADRGDGSSVGAYSCAGAGCPVAADPTPAPGDGAADDEVALGTVALDATSAAPVALSLAHVALVDRSGAAVAFHLDAPASWWRRPDPPPAGWPGGPRTT